MTHLYHLPSILHLKWRLIVLRVSLLLLLWELSGASADDSSYGQDLVDSYFFQRFVIFILNDVS